MAERIGSWGANRENGVTMARNHTRKSRTRRAQQPWFASAAAGAGHEHAGPDMEVDVSVYGVEQAPDMATATALVGACMAACQPCQRSLTAKLLKQDPMVLTVLADVYTRFPDDGEPGSMASDATRDLYPLIRQAGPRPPTPR